MAKWIQPPRVRAAIVALAEWRQRAQNQSAMHLWPLLALVEKGVSKTIDVEFTESDDKAFWDRYGRKPDENRQSSTSAGFAQDYYIEPLVRAMKPADYPHRSPSSIRTRTFLNSWKAATFDAATNRWHLAPNYADIFVNKVLRRGSAVHRVPIVDLAVWLFREREFNDTATAETLAEVFQSTFNFGDDYDRLFEFRAEDESMIFTTSKPSTSELVDAISAAVLPSEPNLEPPPPLFPPPGPEKSALNDDDPVLLQVRRLLEFGTSGIIFRGCPGTSKTWYAKQVARQLVASADDVFQVQFHPSYGYEDFIEGYRPKEESKSGFAVVDKVFLDACAVARDRTTPIVFIVDEINRGDPARIFGELLTYIETDYRGTSFYKPYTGTTCDIPPNLIILATMNQHDKSITQLDFALLRRFDHIDLFPSSETVELFLQNGEFTPEQIQTIVAWFENLQAILPTESGGIGHTYFKNVRRADDLQLVWNYRMLPYCESILELEPQKLENARRSFEAMYRAVIGQTGPAV